MLLQCRPKLDVVGMKTQTAAKRRAVNDGHLSNDMAVIDVRKGEQAQDIPSNQLRRTPSSRHSQLSGPVLPKPRAPSNGVWRRCLDRPDICNTIERWCLLLRVHIDQRPYGEIPCLLEHRKTSEANGRPSNVHLAAVEKVYVLGGTQEYDLAG